MTTRSCPLILSSLLAVHPGLADDPAFYAELCRLTTRREPRPADGDARLRVIIETDAGGDPDDEQSLVRSLVYANEECPGKPYFWANRADAWRGTTNRDNTLARWAADLQNDFRTRLDWCVKSRDVASHRPVAAPNGDTRRNILRTIVGSGEVVSGELLGQRVLR